MEERGQKYIQTERLVGLMEGLDTSRSTFHIITLRDTTMEEGTTGTDTQQDHP
jgi:hypothetical protein